MPEVWEAKYSNERVEFMTKPQYKRVLIKISGEALAGAASRGLDFGVIGGVCHVIKKCADARASRWASWWAAATSGGREGRGRQDGAHPGRPYGHAGHHLNCLALADVMEQAAWRSGSRPPLRCAPSPSLHPLPRHPASGEGEGGHLRLRHRQPLFSPPIPPRSSGPPEIDADAILLAKNIDGVYSADPNKDPSAVKYDTITYDEILAQHLRSWTPPPRPCPWTTRFPWSCSP